MAPYDGSEPADAVLAIARELERFSATLAQRERWLVLNKRDLVDDETFAQRKAAVLDALNWSGPIYEIAAISGDGTQTLCGDLMRYLEDRRAAEKADPELAEAEREHQRQMQAEARERIEQLRSMRRGAAAEDDESALDDDAFDDDVEVEYRP